MGRSSALRLISVVACTVICSLHPGAQPADPPAAILIVQPAGGATMVVLTYASSLPHERARSHVSRLARGTHSRVVSLDVKDTELSKVRDGRKVVQTGAEAVLEGGSFVLADAFVLQPVVEALSDTSRFDVLFFGQPSRPFRGLENFEADGVRIRLTQVGNPYRYSVFVAEGTRSIPKIPVHQPVSGQQAPRTPAQRSTIPWGWLTVFAAGGATGAAVFGLLRYRTMRRTRRAV